MRESIMFSKNHLWLAKCDDKIKIGLSDFAIKSMRSIVFINLPENGDTLTVGESFGDIESLKTVSELISPVSGTVDMVNEALVDEPDMIITESENNWLIIVSANSFSDELMTSDEYAELVNVHE